MKLLRLLILFSLLLGLFSCSVDDVSLEPVAAEEEIAVSGDDSVNSLNDKYRELLTLVNDLRRTGCRCGNENMPPVGEIAWSEQLAIAAERHNRDMESNNHFSHTGTDGSTIGQRVSATGYVWRTVGENIAVGYRSPAAVFSGWKNSPGHCRNIMNGGFREMGVAELNNYWTQDFAAKR